jgi:NTE family protein
MNGPRIALCLGGGGVTGAMYQIGVLAALEDAVEGLQANDFDLYVGASSGASVAAALAGGRPVQRIYRAVLDPADDYFPLERKHLLRMDLPEWRRAIATSWEVIQQGTESLLSRTPGPSPDVLWEQLDRFYDSLPAGFFALDAYERFLEEFFIRRGVPNHFVAMPRRLRIMAHDLDSGEAVFFGSPGFDHVPVTRTCCASLALPPFYSPVRIGGRDYIDAGAAQVEHLDAAVRDGADVVVVVNPVVPVRTPGGSGAPADRQCVRDKGLMRVSSQAIRIASHKLLGEACKRVQARGDTDVVLIEPEPTDAILFLHNPASFAARRQILEYGYRTTRARMTRWFATGSASLRRAGWKTSTPPGSRPSSPPLEPGASRLER